MLRLVSQKNFSSPPYFDVFYTNSGININCKRISLVSPNFLLAIHKIQVILKPNFMTYTLLCCSQTHHGVPVRVGLLSLHFTYYLKDLDSICGAYMGGDSSCMCLYASLQEGSKQHYGVFLYLLFN